MNWDRFEGQWKQLKGGVQERWGEITTNPWHVTEGKRKQRAGASQESYGIGKEHAQRMLREWSRSSNRAAN